MLQVITSVEASPLLEIKKLGVCTRKWCKSVEVMVIVWLSRLNTKSSPAGSRERRESLVSKQPGMKTRVKKEHQANIIILKAAVPVGHCTTRCNYQKFQLLPEANYILQLDCVVCISDGKSWFTLLLALASRHHAAAPTYSFCRYTCIQYSPTFFHLDKNFVSDVHLLSTHKRIYWPPGRMCVCRTSINVYTQAVTPKCIPPIMTSTAFDHQSNLWII